MCLCLEDIEDSELLEMMDVCDQECSLNPSTQQDTVQSTDYSDHTGIPKPSAAEVVKGKILDNLVFTVLPSKNRTLKQS